MKALLTLAVFLVLFNGCKNSKPKESPDLFHAKHDEGYYTCSMHPQIMADKPGNCPICSMKRIKVKRVSKPAEGGVHLSEQQMQLGNILTDTIKGGMMGSQMVLTTTLNADQRRIKAVSARVMGRIEQLYFKNTGDYVRKGDKLYDLYSEELNNAKQEYLLALDKENNLENSLIDFIALTKSAKNKLLLWGLSSAQIREITVNKLATPITTFYSPASGTITNIAVGEGEYTMEGGTILKLTDLSTLWAESQVYTYQLVQVEKNSVASVQFPDLPGKHTDGRIEFANPEINPQTRINLLRVGIRNSENLLKPGMPAFVTLKGKQLDAITLPSDAVLRAEKSVSVWVQTGERSFTSRIVKLGKENGNQVQIKSGLQSNVIVVISGAYLLNSEYLFKNGANPMEGMKM